MQKGGKPKAHPLTSAGRVMLVDYRSPWCSTALPVVVAATLSNIVLDVRTGTVDRVAARDLVQVLLRQPGRLHFLLFLREFPGAPLRHPNQLASPYKVQTNEKRGHNSFSLPAEYTAGASNPVSRHRVRVWAGQVGDLPTG
jgi:hypothetical protein